MTRPLNAEELREFCRISQRMRSLQISADDQDVHRLIKQLEADHSDTDIFPHLEALIILPAGSLHYVNEPRFAQKRFKRENSYFDGMTTSTWALEALPPTFMSHVKRMHICTSSSLEHEEPPNYHTELRWGPSLKNFLAFKPANLESLSILDDRWTEPAPIRAGTMDLLKEIWTSNTSSLRRLILASLPDANRWNVIRSLECLTELQLGRTEARQSFLKELTGYPSTPLRPENLNYSGIRKVHGFVFGITAVTATQSGLLFVVNSLKELEPHYTHLSLDRQSVPLIFMIVPPKKFVRHFALQNVQSYDPSLATTSGMPSAQHNSSVFESFVHRPNVIHSSSLLSLSLNCSSLKHLHVKSTHGESVEFNDAFVLNLVIGCPELRFLSLAPSESYGTLITFESLVSVVQHARHLKTLHMGMQTSTVLDVPGTEALHRTHDGKLHPSSVTELDLGIVEANADSAVSFFCEFFPQVVAFSSSVCVSSNDRHSTAHHRTAWGVVVKRVLNRKRVLKAQGLSPATQSGLEAYATTAHSHSGELSGVDENWGHCGVGQVL